MLGEVYDYVIHKHDEQGRQRNMLNSHSRTRRRFHTFFFLTGIVVSENTDRGWAFLAENMCHNMYVRNQQGSELWQKLRTQNFSKLTNQEIWIETLYVFFLHFSFLSCWAFVLVSFSSPLLLSFSACLWMMESFYFIFYLGYGHEKHKNVYVIHGGLTFRVQLEKWKHTQRLKPWSLLFELNGFFTHELVDHQTNNILLITWCQTMSQEVPKFPIIGATMFWAQLQV